ncbi:MAG: hypothetical protein ACREBC_34050 [Pyrinomonadaceae bacterium]
MKTSQLGNTRLKVSEITLNAIELGMDYGFKGTSYFSAPSQHFFCG